MINICYLLASVGQESRKSLAGFLWTKELFEIFFQAVKKG